MGLNQPLISDFADLKGPSFGLSQTIMQFIWCDQICMHDSQAV